MNIFKSLLTSLFILSLLTACQPTAPKEPDVPDQPIGGQRDKYGCLGPAGYTYDEEINACIRTWELTKDTRRAAKIAVEEVGPAVGLTVVEVISADCIGCYEVKLAKDDEQISVTLDYWEVVE